MENKYIMEDKEVIGVHGEEHIREYVFTYSDIDFKVLVTKEKEFYNFYIITEMFKQEPINNLDVQEPINNIDTLTKEELLRFMEERAISFYLWHKYNRSYSIDSEKIEKNYYY